MLRPPQVIVLCVLALLTIGVVMVNSAGMEVRPEAQGDLFQALLTSRPVIYMALSLAAMGGVVGVVITSAKLAPKSVSSLRRFAPSSIFLGAAILALVGVLALVYVPGLGREVNGSARWISIPSIGLASIQPSEIAKWGLIFVLACYLGTRKEEAGTTADPAPPPSLAPLAAAALVAGLVAIEDLGTGVLIGAVGAIMVIASGARLWPLVAAAPVGLAGVAMLVLASPYRLERLTSFLNPYADPQGSGYHMIQSMAAIAGGGQGVLGVGVVGVGRGLGHGLQKFGYLPEDMTDFIFAIIAEELGVAGAGVVIALYVALIWASVKIVLAQENPVFRLAGIGIIATIGLQAVLNLFVVTGMAPTKGIALPLVSAGGTGWLLTSAALGLLVAMSWTERQSERRAVSEA